MRVWIDLSNSPHALLFRPLVSRFEELGHTVLLTARDNAQTVELARERWPDVEVVGGPSPSGRLSKAVSLLQRIDRLRRWARAQRPDVALSHNSYAQIAAARGAGVPVLTAMDYEHQPANHLAFRLAHCVLLPEVLRGSQVHRQGAVPSKVRWYEGLKEELYLGDFEPDPEVLEGLGIERQPGDVVVVARTPPTGATYHRFENPLFADALRVLGNNPQVCCVVLTRRPEQSAALGALSLQRCVIPSVAVDSLSLICAADLVIGAGGTMTREAALLGIPSFSLFAGPPARVDGWLRDQGLLDFLTDPRQLEEVAPRERRPRPIDQLRERGARILDVFSESALEIATHTP